MSRYSRALERIAELEAELELRRAFMNSAAVNRLTIPLGTIAAVASPRDEQTR